jgi:fructose-1,6-bisphosphatase/inositol monophosphatase family enzyme
MDTNLRVLLAGAIRHTDSLGDAHLSLALECAIRAGAIIRAGWEGGLDALCVKEKGVGDLVSVVDVQAESAVLDLLAERATGDLILSEETRQHTKPEKGKRMWIVDPLDGYDYICVCCIVCATYVLFTRSTFRTASFVFHTNPELVSVLIALYDGDLHRVTHAVELFPIGDHVWALYARLGGGAFVNGSELRVPESVKVQKSVVVYKYANTNPLVIGPPLPRLGEHESLQ